MVGPKKLHFFAKNQHTWRKRIKKILAMNDSLTKKCLNCIFTVNFHVKKFTEFLKDFSLENINLGDHFLSKRFFSVNFRTTLLQKIMPNFWQTDIHQHNLFNFFSFNYVDSWPKILIFRTHQLWNSATQLTLFHTSCH